MDIFVPFKLLRAETWQFATSVNATLVPLVDDFDYWRYFQNRWNKKTTFINVEQDVVPTLDQLKELIHCLNPWCGFGYEGDPDERPYLGCTKITYGLISRAPNAWMHKTHWSVCDIRLATLQRQIPFCHHGTVKHLESCNPFLDEDKYNIPAESLWQGGKDQS